MTARVLDLFCKAGGAGYGYHLAGGNIPKQRPGPKPESVKVKLRHTTAELAVTRTMAAAYRARLQSLTEASR